MPDGNQVQAYATILKKCSADFEYFGRHMLKVKPKAGGAYVSLELNRAQRYIHMRLEKQLAETGRVRALILKARQQGCSTYIEARFFWKVYLWPLRKAMILTHEDKATQNLFGMAKTYHEQMPELFRQPTLQANANTLRLQVSEGEYAVATAGSKETGRSQTAQLFHGSEWAFWPNAENHAKGIAQIVPNMPDTEIIGESTANGIGGDWHQRWQAAEAGTSEFIAIFCPWYWTDEYRLPVPAGYEFSDEDYDYQALYGVDLEQLFWRRVKIDGDFKGDLAAFQQEYPSNSVEAFSANATSLIPGEHIARARKDQLATPNDTLIIGVDPKREGVDRFGIAWRRGRVCLKVEGSPAKITTMEAAGMLAGIIDRDRPARMFVDIVGLGAGVYDRLVELGYGAIVIPVQAGGAADEPKKYINKRAEMADRCREWMADYPNRIPDDDELARDLMAPQHSRDSNQRLKIETKEAMAKRGIRSPDLGDALHLTFAYPVAPNLGTSQRINLDVGIPWQAR